ncbi:hypothetical protein BUALT_Bualt07G0049000 [Buddleja alternifolia]|uniref:Uncharacterized protein n=1 Tax=Buddleja alternifolia TaxID=168488 RepID=A0AAV6XIV2_9LAMI|nr:hypothetical protein BUALT_Bualt07G0049000 [Buddleja alternifolia]
MDADEKLTALKKAYADVILNISKEAAARVMASERRAARYQHELKAAKDESLRMLMRLKQMMDSRINEAEAASLNQQSKIEELEAQLQEAEDIVKDLREELGEAQSELDRVKNVHVNKPAPSEHYSYQPQDEYVVSSDVTMPNPSHGNECQKCFNKIVSYIGNRDLPSIILRGKDPGLYRNGCTQRIRACERNLSDRELCLSVETDKLRDENNGTLKEEGKGTCKSTVSEFEKKLLADIELSNFQSFLQKKKRASRKRKRLTPLEEKVKDEGLNEKLALLVEEAELAKSLDAHDCDVELKNFEANSSEATEVIPSEPVKERVIKYTFQRRKLKKQALSGCEVNAPLDIENKTVDERNDDQKVEQPKPSLLMESSRDSRRLAQVARQLLSLSEKKWD